ncbi:MAG TPA: GspMb/PilO family protein [Sedimentisphaerales bacterium]|nr:GspMb/PilO family protein [Sedimentisphaerales bacterium]
MKSIYRKYFMMVAVFWLACFVVFLMLYMLVLAPQQGSQRRLLLQLDEKRQLHETAQTAVQDQANGKPEEQLEQLQGRLRDFVIDLEKSGDITLDIGAIATEQEVSSPSINLKDSRTDAEIPGCKRICENYINISFSAPFDKFMTTLGALESHRPVVFVDRFTITRSTRADAEHPVNMELAVFVTKGRNSTGPQAAQVVRGEKVF